jgi:sec-independent protein translocase protein TatB
MFDIGWTELLVIGVVALIVIGPQDLPDMFRQLGRFTGKMRAMARDFQKAMDDAAKSSGMNDVAKDLRNVTSSKGLGLTAVKEAADKFEKWDPLKPAKTATPNTIKPPVPRPAAAPVAATSEELAEIDAMEAAIPSPATIPPMGPNTQAMRDKQNEKRQIVAEAREKLKALENGTARVNPATASIETVPAPAPIPAPAPEAQTTKADEA